MTFDFSISSHEYEAGSVYEDATCYGAYIEVGNDQTYEWFQEHGFEGNGYTILALVEALCKLELKDDAGKYEMEAEADNTWVYGREKAPIDRLLARFQEVTIDEAGVNRLIEHASDDLME
jgi:hypothetical protein